VGAGASIAYGYPGWSAFLDALAVFCRERDPTTDLAAIAQRDVRTRLDWIATRLGDQYPRVFAQTFAPRASGGTDPEWIRLVLDLPLRLLLTTNYTCELEQIARFHPAAPLGPSGEPVRWYESVKLTHAMRRIDGRLRLIYLHGRYDDSPAMELDPEGRPWSRVILGEKSYRFAYERPGTLASRLEAIAQTMTLMTVGCSLDDADIIGTLRSVKALSGSGYPPHYAILPLFEGDNPETVAADYVDQCGLQPLFYPVTNEPEREHAAIEDLLRELVVAATPPRVSPITVAADVATPSSAPPSPRVVHPLLRALDFEPRPLYRRVIDAFLFREEGGMLALIGIGGAGKTALLRDALDPLLAPAEARHFGGLFVWSFYDDPNVANFFRHLAQYLKGRITRDPSETAAFEACREGCKTIPNVMIVLDGLERIQLERADQPMVHGAIENTPLREFLLWIADANTSTKAVVTTRFPMPDLDLERLRDRVFLIDVDSLTRLEARALLRRRGVVGDDAALDKLLNHFGTHALTVDHLGGVIATFLSGDPSRFHELGDGPITRFEVGHAGRKLTRVLLAYDHYLSRAEPMVRDTLQRIAIFPHAVTAEFLAKVFLKPDRSKRAGSLAGKTAEQLTHYLDRLVTLRFLRHERVRSEVRYSIHPAVRQVVIESLGSRRGDVTTAAREEMELDLASRPQTEPSDETTLDFIEDLIGFCLDDNDFERAYGLYRDRLGGYDHLGTVIGNYDRGERITQRLLAAAHSAFSWRRALLGNDHAMFLLHVGRLREAVVALRELQRSTRGERFAAGILINLAEAEWLCGNLDAAAPTENSNTTAENRAVANGLIGRTAFARGDIALAFSSYTQALGHQWGSETLIGLPAFYFEQALNLCGHPDKSLKHAQRTQELHRQKKWAISAARSQLAAADALVRLKRCDEAGAELEAARTWAVGADEKELVLLSTVTEARLAFARGDLHRAEEIASDVARSCAALGYKLFEAESFGILARALLSSSLNNAAESHASQALSLFKSVGYIWGELDCLRVLEQVRPLTSSEVATLRKYEETENVPWSVIEPAFQKIGASVTSMRDAPVSVSSPAPAEHVRSSFIRELIDAIRNLLPRSSRPD
jgi:hypothetical protein